MRVVLRVEQKFIDKLKEKGYNIGEVSEYARFSLDTGLIDQAYTGYRVIELLKE